MKKIVIILEGIDLYGNLQTNTGLSMKTLLVIRRCGKGLITLNAYIIHCACVHKFVLVV